MPRLTLTEPRDVRNAWIVWAAFLLIICVIVGRPTNTRTATPILRDAAIQWFAGNDIYTEGIHGFLYLPSAVVVYAPFAWPPFSASEVLWRIVSIGGLASAVWRLARLARQEGPWELFPLITLLSIPPAMGSARYGQPNLLLAALIIHAVIELANERWWRATLWISLGLALKPLMIVLILLAGAIYRPMTQRLFAGVAVVLLLPFATQHPAYVMRQYELCAHKLVVASRPGELARFSDLFGIVGSLGIDTPYGVQTAVRALGAAFTLGLCWWGVRQWGRVRGSALLLALASCYLMLFNPRTENNSYAILGPAVAVFAAWALLVDRWRAVGWTLVAIVAGISGSYEITRGTNYWLNPSLCLIFLAYLAYLLLARHRPASPVAASK